MLCAPISCNFKNMSESFSGVISSPIPLLLIVLFWQNTHFNVQFEKNTVPEPFLPEMHGSSQWWREYLATFGFLPDKQYPISSFSLFAPQFLGQRQQFDNKFSNFSTSFLKYSYYITIFYILQSKTLQNLLKYCIIVVNVNWCILKKNQLN